MEVLRRYLVRLLLVGALWTLFTAYAQPQAPSFLEAGGRYQVVGSSLPDLTTIEILSIDNLPWLEVRAGDDVVFWLNLDQLAAIYPAEGAATASGERVDAIAQACLQAVVSEQYIRRVDNSQYTPLGSAVDNIANCDNVAVREIRVTPDEFRYVAQHTTSQTTFEVTETGIVTRLD